MAHGVNEVLGEGSSVKMVHQKQQQHQSVHQYQQQPPPQQQQQNARKSVGVMGSRRIFPPAFKLRVLDSYRNDIDCRGNQRATARKYGIHRRQIQKWLQCEDTLRNSCAESGNTGVVSSTVIASAGVSKSDGTVTEATGPAVTPAAPALNLSLARLHGDELATQQGPPPPLLPPRPPHGGSPSSPQYAAQSGAAPSDLPIRLGYQEYSASNSEQQQQQQQQQHHHHHHHRHVRRDAEDRVQQQQQQVTVDRRHCRDSYTDVRAHLEVDYYVVNSDGDTQRLDGSTSSSSSSSSFEERTEAKLYRAFPAFGVVPSHRYGTEAENHRLRSPSASHPHQRRPRLNYPDADSSMDGKSSSDESPPLAPSMIKAERASPDSAATPGPAEPMGTPDASRVPLSPVTPALNGNRGTGSSFGSTASVHFDSPRASASPGAPTYAHVHGQRGPWSPGPDSEKPIPPSLHRSRQRESEETTTGSHGVGGEKGIEGIASEAEIGRAVVKEEIRLQEEEEEEEAAADEDDQEVETAAMTINGQEGTEAVDASAYVDHHRPPAVASSLADSRPTSPVHDREGYSLPGSPRGPNSSSGRSSTSCSDSETDPLDCSSGSHHSSSDLARRRSFSLRFKLDVLDAFHRDVGVAGNQRATARKFGINRRQVQKWLGQETELRGEIALRGNSRQRLGPVQDAASGDSPVDLRTSNYGCGLSRDRIDVEYERSPPPPLYCCDVGSSSSASSTSSSQHLPYYQQHPGIVEGSSSEGEQLGSCNLSCCMDVGPAATPPAPLCYQDAAFRGSSCYSDAPIGFYCYSPREAYSSEIASIPEQAEELSSPFKRQHCPLSCCLEPLSPPKRLCLDEAAENCGREAPPQDIPLCLVKPKRHHPEASPTRTEPVTSTVPSPPASGLPPPSSGPTSKKDEILFKPYLDNPVSKPAKEQPQPAIRRDSSPIGGGNAINDNCQSICNPNEGGRGHDYALELSLRLPVSWRAQPSPYIEFPQVRSAFVRYPASPRYS